MGSTGEAVNWGLQFAWGTSPKNPEEARVLGWEECKLEQRMQIEPGGFRIYVHAASVPELCSFVRAMGRDCTHEPFAEKQALLMVGPSPTGSGT